MGDDLFSHLVLVIVEILEIVMFPKVFSYPEQFVTASLVEFFICFFMTEMFFFLSNQST